jgi:hypothetical protein
MTFPINAGGLFDFDLTFVAEGVLFFILSLVVTFLFLSPISEQLDSRAALINFNLRKSSIILMFGYEKLSNSIILLTKELSELNRQLKLIKNYSNSNFETEITSIQSKNVKILSKLKGDLSIKSASIFSTISNDLIKLTNTFFAKKFQSI